jgi:heme exporter protein D
MIGDTSLYVWGAYAMGLALVLTEIALLLFRDKTIRGHLGWFRVHRQPTATRQAPCPEPTGGKA